MSDFQQINTEIDSNGLMVITLDRPLAEHYLALRNILGHMVEASCQNLSRRCRSSRLRPPLPTSQRL